LLKESLIPSQSNRFLFISAPCFILLISLLMWGFIPLAQVKLLFNTGYSLLYIYAFSSLSVVAIILAG